MCVCVCVCGCSNGIENYTDTSDGGRGRVWWLVVLWWDVTLYCWCDAFRKVLVIENHFTSPCPWISSPCPPTSKSSKIVKDFVFCKQSIIYDHVKSINSVTATMHEDTVKNVLLLRMSNITYWCMSVSKSFFTTSSKLLGGHFLLFILVAFLSSSEFLGHTVVCWSQVWHL